MRDYFRSSINIAVDNSKQGVNTKIHNEFSDFLGIGCFEGIMRLQVKDGSWPYQVPLRKVVHELQEPSRRGWTD